MSVTPESGEVLSVCVIGPEARPEPFIQHTKSSDAGIPAVLVFVLSPR